MKEIIKFGKSDTMTSLEIAEVTGKAHKNIMRTIRNMESAWEKVQGLKFELLQKEVETNNGGRKMRPYYSLNKTECLYIATKFNNEARAKLVLRWEELERSKRKNEISLPDFSNPAEAARAWASEYEQKQQLVLENKRQAEKIEAKNAEIAELSTTISEMQPKVNYVDTILSSKKTVTTTQIAQDYGLSAKSFNILLRNFGIQRKVGGQWILCAKYLPYGFVQSVTVSITHPDGSAGSVMYTKWTQKGRLFLYDELKHREIRPLIEK